MSTYNSPTDLLPLTKARSIDINTLDAAVADGFARLPDENVITSGTTTYAVDIGTGPNFYIVNLVKPPASYIDGMEVTFRTQYASTGPSAINVNSLGVVAIKNLDGSDIQYEILPNVPITVRYSSATGAFYIENSSTATAIAAAAAAAASAAAAAATAGAGPWVSGTNYAIYAAVISPLNMLTYRRRVSGVSTVDPSLDRNGWRSISGLSEAQLWAAALSF